MKITPEQIEQVQRVMTELIPFNAWLGMKVDSLEEGRAQLSIPFRPEFVGDPFRQALHGGVIASLIDAAGGAAVWTVVHPLDPIATIDLRVDYLRPGKAAPLCCQARVIRAGRQVAVVSMSAFHEGAPELLIAEGRGVYHVKRRQHDKQGQGPPG